MEKPDGAEVRQGGNNPSKARSEKNVGVLASINCASIQHFSRLMYVHDWERMYAL